MIEVMTERVMVETRTAAKETNPPRVKFMNPAFIILFNSVMLINIKLIITQFTLHVWCLL